MRAVDVGVGHDDDLAVAQAFEVELFADAACRGPGPSPAISLWPSTLSMRAFSTLMILPFRGRMAWKR